MRLRSAIDRWPGGKEIIWFPVLGYRIGNTAELSCGSVRIRVIRGMAEELPGNMTGLVLQLYREGTGCLPNDAGDLFAQVRAGFR